MSIPTKFTLGAIEWTISVDDTEMSNDGSLGMCDHIIKDIKIAKNYRGQKLTPESIELTIYHEAVHVILCELGEFELNKNEEFVHKFSLLLHQFEKTKK